MGIIVAVEVLIILWVEIFMTAKSNTKISTPQKLLAMRYIHVQRYSKNIKTIYPLCIGHSCLIPSQAVCMAHALYSTGCTVSNSMP